jgi:hypothetical protein
MIMGSFNAGILIMMFLVSVMTLYQEERKSQRPVIEYEGWIFIPVYKRH